MQTLKISKATWLEASFQGALLLIVFVFFASHREHGQVKFQLEHGEIVFFLNYVFAAYTIGYFLLQKFLYVKKYLQFGLGVLGVIATVILLEEGVIEQIYYPDTRGKYFPGIFNSLIDALPTIAILAGFKFGWDAFRKQQELDALSNAMKESELQFLKSQINPHFLFNNLNNLYSYALEQSPKTPDVILQLSSVLRYMLYECKEELVPLDKEIEQLKSFVELGKIQFENRGHVNFQVFDAQKDFKIAPLILSVFIENAFKHSLASQTGEIDIDIHLKISEQGTLNFKCENTFLPDSNDQNLGKGIGLENVTKRLNLIYPNKYDLQISNKNQRYEVFLILELDSQEA